MRWNSGIAALAAVLFVGGVARAQEPVTVTQSGMVLFTIRAEEFGMTPRKRADGVYDRLRYILGDPKLRSSDIKVVMNGGVAKIVARGVLIVQLGDAEAKASKMTLTKVANTWANQLRKTLPRAAARPDSPIPMGKVSPKMAPKKKMPSR